jgi:hypothetical protein
MPHQAQDEEFRWLETLSATLEPEYEESDAAWIGSPFAWIRKRPSRQRGKIFEQLLAGWLAAREFAVAPASSSDFDRFVDGYRVEVKGSTLWESGVYKFQQIRDQKYDLVICLGLSPFTTHCWVLPKETLHTFVIGKMGQHGGKAAQDTDWISFNPDEPYSWLTQWGGTLSQALEVLRRLGPGPHLRQS